MDNTTELRGLIQDRKRKAKAMLAEKGSRAWTPVDQAAFDVLMEEAEHAESMLSAHERLHAQNDESSFSDARLSARNRPKTTVKHALDLYLRKSIRDMLPEEALLVRNTMSTTTGSQGGYAVQAEVSSEFFSLIRDFGAMRRVAQTFKTENGADLSLPSSDGRSENGEWLPENASATPGDVVFGTRPMNSYKYGSKVISIPLELVQDSEIDITGMVMRRAVERIGRIQNQHFSSGSGSGQPAGLAIAADVAVVATAGHVLDITFDDLYTMVEALDPAYYRNAEARPDGPKMPGWMFSQWHRRIIRKLKDNNGRPIWTPCYDEGMSAATPDRLLGYPVYINNDMPLYAANAKTVAFGDLNQYVIREAMDLELFRFDDSSFIKLGMIGYLAWSRAGGNLIDPSAVKVYQQSAT